MSNLKMSASLVDSFKVMFKIFDALLNFYKFITKELNFGQGLLSLKCQLNLENLASASKIQLNLKNLEKLDLNLKKLEISLKKPEHNLKKLDLT